MSLRRIVVLLALAMAVTMVLFAPMAEAKKKHHHKKRLSVPSAPVNSTPVNPALTYNVVNCQPYVRCDGTPGNDYLRATSRRPTR